MRTATLSLTLLLLTALAGAEIVKFGDPHPRGNVIEYWRLTHDPALRDHANYHNTDCFSPDGRYVCLTRYVAPDLHHLDPHEVRVIDLHTGEDRLIGIGSSPRWAQMHNWLFYVRTNRGPDDSWEAHSEVVRHDLDTGEEFVVTRDMQWLGSTDRLDRWIFGNRWRYDNPDDTPRKTVRARIEPNAELEQICEINQANRPLCNPGHDLISIRCHLDGPFEHARMWMDYDGSNQRTGVPMVQNAHCAWSGDGTWQLVGNGRARGRLWNEPFPSNLHVLAWMSFGDISPCGRSGRWICGDYGVADLRTADGVDLPRAPSSLCYPASIIDHSGPYDADPKGSPDGTKVSFVSNYPFDTAPHTRLMDALGDQESVRVESTDGFPPSGEIDVLTEVIAYASKTETAFEGLERHRYATGGRETLNAGLDVTLFSARLMTEDERRRSVEPWPWLARAVRDAGMDEDCPLLHQRQTDVYISVVRLPDPPWLREVEGGVELIPGENHRETFGYHLLRDGERVTAEPLRPGEQTALQPGTWLAVAVEWSGLEGIPSPETVVEAETRLTVPPAIPDDFSWIVEQWRVEERPSDRVEALAADRATREVHQRAEGLFRIESHEQGLLTYAEDVNTEGFACRRETYAGGTLSKREIWQPMVGTADRLRTSELFTPAGFKTEEMHFGYPETDGPPVVVDHWWYQDGWPVRRERHGGAVWEKRGDDWLRAQ
ncbi:MAG: hypothetical protein ACOX9R_06405 [Armatimonadota bacterium]|jgi:hypothetical protein